MDDFELIKKAKDGDTEAVNSLMKLYKPFVSVIARKYFLANSSFDDLIQEGMLGLFKAYLDFDINGKASFKTFASICINRQIQTAIIKNNRNKNLPLNKYFSINNQGKILLSIKKEEVYDDEEENGFYILSNSPTPEESILFKEQKEEFNNKFCEILSDFEKKVLYFYLCGLNYIEISKKLKKQPKSIDNALSRIKIKLKELRCI